MATDKRRKAKRTSGTYERDSLVSIDGIRLRSAIELRGLSVKAAAESVHEKQSTLNSIVNQEVRRCRLSRRRKLAKLLNVPERWLAGEIELEGLPTPAVGRIPNAQRLPDGTWGDVYYTIVPGEVEPRPPSDTPPQQWPRVSLEAWEALNNLRYLFDPSNSPIPEHLPGSSVKRILATLPSGPDTEREMAELPHDIVAIFSLEQWRAALYGGQPGRWHATAEESDRFAAAMGAVLRLLFAPSTKGDMGFDLHARRATHSAQRWINKKLRV